MEFFLLYIWRISLTGVGVGRGPSLEQECSSFFFFFFTVFPDAPVSQQTGLIVSPANTPTSRALQLQLCDCKWISSASFLAHFVVLRLRTRRQEEREWDRQLYLAFSLSSCDVIMKWRWRLCSVDGWTTGGVWVDVLIFCWGRLDAGHQWNSSPVWFTLLYWQLLGVNTSDWNWLFFSLSKRSK